MEKKMPPCRKERYCRRLEGKRGFKPMGFPAHTLKTTEIELDEFEALRLCDLEGKNQIEAGEIMGISRGTIQRLVNSGRAKIVEALLHNQIIIINDETGAKNE
jgi:predicted DNA-binding protein (UPF0251 family)